MVVQSGWIAWQMDPLIKNAPKMPIMRKARIFGLIVADLLLLFGHPGALF